MRGKHTQRGTIVPIIVAISLALSRGTDGSPRLSSGTAGRIDWQGGSWYLHGANLPWFTWGCDFGCGEQGGVSSRAVQEQIEPVLSRAHESGVRVVRWWMFPGDAAAITRDERGVPSGIKPVVYDDIDAALRLAETYDIYYVFTLFSAPSHIPAGWRNDPEQRAALAHALGPLFARYRDNPRVFTWDVINEPEWDIWQGRTDKDKARDTVKAIVDAVHANSRAYVTTASATLDGLGMWVGAGFDFYTANWYDYMASGNWCARCTDYPRVRERYQLDAPLVIGEFDAGPSTDAATRFRDWYAKGYAGALAWSLLPEKTADRLSIDLDALAGFSSEAPDLGPGTKR